MRDLRAAATFGQVQSLHRSNVAYRTLGALLAVLTPLPACSSDNSSGPGQAGASAGGASSGAGGSTAPGTSGSAGRATDAGAGAGADSAGAPNTGLGGAGGGGGVAGSVTAGASAAGSAAAGASTAGTSAGGAAGGGSNPPGKGASGKAVCAGLSGFVDPSLAMGTISEVKAPQGSFFAFIEGPVWVASSKRVFFSDNAGSPERIWRYDPATQMLDKFLEPSGSNGLAVDGSDQLVVADQVNRTLYRLDPSTKTKATSVISGNFKPNDLVVRSDGGIYVTDPDSGLYYVAPGGSEAKLVSKAVNRPNGIVLTLDETALIVGDVGNQSLSKFTLAANGSVMDPPTAFGKTTGQTADGMCMDCGGNVFVSTQTGVEIFDTTGKKLGTVPTGEASNCTFGGDDKKTLFVTSRAVLKVVKLSNPGLPD